MKSFIYTLKDVKRGSFLSIWTEANDDTRKRNFDAIKQDKNTIFGMYPGDFELWRLGSVDEHVGIISEEPKFITGGTPVAEVLQ